MMDVEDRRGVLGWFARHHVAANLQHVARGVYSAALPPIPAAGIEYYIEVTTDDGQQLVFPATAPRLNQTVVVLPAQFE